MSAHPLFRNAQSRQTHCGAGHPLSGPNLYETPEGRRRCRACHRVRARAWSQRNREKRLAASRAYREENRAAINVLQRQARVDKQRQREGERA
ncbi:MAG: hypothetical protein M3Q74_13230 [Pseudomonadota bacterium]|nr:hypothetical protein [Pseudomonadota bacterium]